MAPMRDTFAEVENAAHVLYEAIEAWNLHDIEEFVSLMAKDVVWDYAGEARVLHGREEMRKWATAVWKAFPDFKVELAEPIYEQGESCRLAAHVHVEATWHGKLDPPGFAPTHRHLCLDAIDLVEVRDRLIHSIVSRFDTLRAAEMLGLLPARPAPGSTRERLTVLFQSATADLLYPRK